MPPSNRRRLPQFRLRTILLATAVTAMVLGFISRPLVERRQEQTILETIGFQDVSANYEYVPFSGASVFSFLIGSEPYQRVHTLSLGGRMSDDVSLDRLAELKHLRVLKLASTQVSDDELAGVQRLTDLEELDLSDTLVTDAGMVHLQGLKKLSRLRLAGTAVSYEALERLQESLPGARRLVQCRAAEEIERAGGYLRPNESPAEHAIVEVNLSVHSAAPALRHLSRLPHLKRLLLRHVTDDSLKHIEGLIKLEELDLWASEAVTNDGLKHLSKLTSLKKLKLNGERIDDAGLVHLARLSKLEELHLVRTGVTGLGLGQLTEFKQLRVLNLNEVPFIYDLDLESFREMKMLRRLGLNAARISEKGAAALRHSLPSVAIELPTHSPEPSPDLGVPRNVDLPTEGTEAFWDGDYDEMCRIFRQFVSSRSDSWQGHLWLGHAHELANRRPDAVAAYKTALTQLDRKIANTTSDSEKHTRRLLCQYREKLLLLTQRIELFQRDAPNGVVDLLHAGLRPPGEQQPIPEPGERLLPHFEPSPQSPFRLLAPENRTAQREKHSTAALVELNDGRLLAALVGDAFADPRISFSTSSDGTSWETPWEFSYNSVFPTGGPTLIVDDDGTVWMVYVSKRPTIELTSSAHYRLWTTHSPDGRNWSTPKPVHANSQLHPERPTQITRGPEGRYWILVNGEAGTGQSPDNVKQLRRINVPIRDKTVTPMNAHATFDSQGHCHLVFDDFGSALYYSRSDDMASWSALVKLAEKEPGSNVSHPQLILHADRAALLYTTTQGKWLRRGVMTADGLDLDEPIQLADHTWNIPGARLLQTGDQVFLPVQGDPLQLLVADVRELTAEERVGKMPARMQKTSPQSPNAPR